MSSRARLDQYLHQARQRLGLVLLSRGAALLLGVLLLVSVLAALWITRSAFSDTAAVLSRCVLAAAICGVGVYGWFHWRALRRHDGADALEAALPAQGGRIHTYLQERRKDEQGTSFLLDLLAEDTVRVAEAEPLAQSIPSRRIWAPAAMAAVAVGAIGRASCRERV